MASRIFTCLLALGLTALTPSSVLALQPPAQGEFAPFTGVPPDQQMPAAPLVIGAYAFFLLLMMFYLWTIWRRIEKVEADMRVLERRQAAAGPGSSGTNTR
jgi:hypothetical protein